MARFGWRKLGCVSHQRTASTGLGRAACDAACARPSRLQPAVYVDCINAHGTGTPHNDSAEANAIHELFGDEVPVVSTKGYTGHTLGAAGATEAVLASFALTDGWIPASPGATPVDERITINIATERRAGSFRRVLSNSFAFGGNNVSVLLRSA